MLTSTRNPKVQWVRSLQGQARTRREERAFVVEGVRLVEEAIQAGLPAELVLYSSDLGERGLALVRACQQRGLPVEEAAPAVMKAAADTETPQGILAVLPIRPLALPQPLDFVLLLDGLRDPGNLGTILRTAAAAGVQAALLAPGCADPYAPKVVRAAMGAHFRLPIHTLGWPEIRSLLGDAVRLYLADSGGGLPYTQVDLRAPLAIIVGGEAEGAGQQARQAAERIHIPMPGESESLNAGVAAAILLFEVVRQRSTGAVMRQDAEEINP